VTVADYRSGRPFLLLHGGAGPQSVTGFAEEFAAAHDVRVLVRLATLEIPTLVLWGDSDQIVDVCYGRAYAAAIPMARFQLLTATGHSPQLETPDQVDRAVWETWRTQLSASAPEQMGPRRQMG
jgi:pimeloyl-ACP methyl ester carboxylesterase